MLMKNRLHPPCQCGRKIQKRQMCCLACWKRVPGAMRYGFTTAVRAEMKSRYARTIFEWLRDNPEPTL